MTDVTQIKWQRGNYLKFYALMKIRVGGTVPVDIQEGDEFDYDGSILRYAGAELGTPQLRGAIKNSWATLDESDVGAVSIAAFKPGRNVAKTQSINTDLSRVSRGSLEPMETDSFDEEVVLKVSDRRPDSKNNPRAPAKLLTKDANRRTAGMRIDSEGGEDQEAVTVGRVRSPARLKVEDMTKSSSHGIAREIENRGLGRPELFEREGITFKTTKNIDKNVRIAQDEDEGVVVGKIRRTDTRSSGASGDISIKDTSNIRSTAASQTSAKIDMKLSPKIRVALRIDPSFPTDWSFFGKMTDRLAAVKAHGESPLFLDALYAAEGDQMRKMLSLKYPKQFGSK